MRPPRPEDVVLRRAGKALAAESVGLQLDGFFRPSEVITETGKSHVSTLTAGAAHDSTLSARGTGFDRQARYPSTK